MASKWFVRTARALLRPSSIELGCVEIYNCEDRRSEPNILHWGTDLNYRKASEYKKAQRIIDDN
jgi:hypothetical protein